MMAPAYLLLAVSCVGLAALPVLVVANDAHLASSKANLLVNKKLVPNDHPSYKVIRDTVCCSEYLFRILYRSFVLVCWRLACVTERHHRSK